MANKLVRLKPYNPKKHINCKIRIYGGHKFVGGAKPRWYRVDGPLASELGELHQDDNNADSPLNFDVVADKDGANALETKERIAREKLEASANAPQDLTTQDLTKDVKTERQKKSGKDGSRKKKNK